MKLICIDQFSDIENWKKQQQQEEEKSIEAFGLNAFGVDLKSQKAKETNNKRAKVPIWNCNWKEIIHDFFSSFFYRFILESELSFFS